MYGTRGICAAILRFCFNLILRSALISHDKNCSDLAHARHARQLIHRNLATWIALLLFGLAASIARASRAVAWSTHLGQLLAARLISFDKVSARLWQASDP